LADASDAPDKNASAAIVSPQPIRLLLIFGFPLFAPSGGFAKQ
jgi:hypothetical protein